MFKLIIAGGRDFDNYIMAETWFLRYLLDNGLGKESDTEIVSGAARGADKVGEMLASNYNLPCKRFPANWDLHGKSAGYKRNAEMAEYADGLLAFWDGKSKGTKHMIDLANKKGLNVKVVNY